MINLSGIIIAKNAENIIADCLDSLSFCDEIILIDNSSTDRTVDIAETMKAKVFVLDSTNFAQIRNEGMKKAKGKWLVYLDADERIDVNLKENILLAIKQKSSDYSAFLLKRKNFYLGNHEWPNIERILRLFKKEKLSGWSGELHETANVEGNIGELEGFINHYTHQSLSAMVEKTNNWSEIEANLRFQTRHPAMRSWRFFRVMFTAFYDSYVKQRGYKAGTAGLIESIYQAFSMFITYAKLWEKQQQDK